MDMDLDKFFERSLISLMTSLDKFMFTLSILVFNCSIVVAPIITEVIQMVEFLKILKTFGPNQVHVY